MRISQEQFNKLTFLLNQTIPLLNTTIQRQSEIIKEQRKQFQQVWSQLEQELAAQRQERQEFLEILKSVSGQIINSLDSKPFTTSINRENNQPIDTVAQQNKQKIDSQTDNIKYSSIFSSQTKIDDWQDSEWTNPIIADTNTPNNESEILSETHISFLSAEEQYLVDCYNNEPQKLSNYMIAVSEPESSIKARRYDAKTPAFFAQQGQSMYSIILAESKQYYLFPKIRLKINQHSIDSVESAFECRNFQAGIIQKYQLVQPAKVEKLPNGEQWQLQARGILEFYDISNNEDNSL